MDKHDDCLDLGLDQAILQDSRNGEFLGVVLVAAVLITRTTPFIGLVLVDIENGDKEGIRYIDGFISSVKHSKLLLPGEKLQRVVFDRVPLIDLLDKYHHVEMGKRRRGGEEDIQLAQALQDRLVAATYEIEKPAHLEGLARNLAAAVCAYQLGIGMDYCKKTYLRGKPGDLWYYLAKISQEGLQKGVDSHFHPKATETTVQ